MLHFIVVALCLLAAPARANPALGQTDLFRTTVHDCVAVDLAGWKHPTRDVLAARHVEFEGLQLCNGGRYPIYRVAFEYNPEGNNDSFFLPLYAAVYEANFFNSLAFVDTSYDVVVTLTKTGPAHDVSITYEDFTDSR